MELSLNECTFSNSRLNSPALSFKNYEILFNLNYSELENYSKLGKRLYIKQNHIIGTLPEKVNETLKNI